MPHHNKHQQQQQNTNNNHSSKKRSSNEPTHAECLQDLLKFRELPKTIFFYSHRNSPFGVFSNFSSSPITINGLTYPTSEHYFQAMKFHEACPKPPSGEDFVNEHVVACMTALSPGDTAKMGRDRSRPLVKCWEEAKEIVMFDAITAKFLQHDELFQILMKTESRQLIERTKNDSYWATGTDVETTDESQWPGKNRLGALLVELRTRIRVFLTNHTLRSDVSSQLRNTGVNLLRTPPPRTENKANNNNNSSASNFFSLPARLPRYGEPSGQCLTTSAATSAASGENANQEILIVNNAVGRNKNSNNINQNQNHNTTAAASASTEAEGDNNNNNNKKKKKEIVYEIVSSDSDNDNNNNGSGGGSKAKQRRNRLQ